jgi:hypothetical protein
VIIAHRQSAIAPALNELKIDIPLRMAAPENPPVRNE